MVPLDKMAHFPSTSDETKVFDLNLGVVNFTTDIFLPSYNYII